MTALKVENRSLRRIAPGRHGRRGTKDYGSSPVHDGLLSAPTAPEARDFEVQHIRLRLDSAVQLASLLAGHLAGLLSALVRPPKSE